MTDDRTSRIQILLQQKKYNEAEKILKQLLADDPNDTDLLYLLAETSLQLEKIEEAKSIVHNAIGIAPDAPHLFYIKARIALHEEKMDDAENDIRQAIALDPNDADYVALLAHTKLIRKQYAEALELADNALAIDAENLLGLNTRSTALLKLNKKDESFQTIQGALRGDPNNAYTHANYGWGLLEKGEHKKALEHFKESLKNDPNNDYAKAGMTEALKASNFIYRIYLKYAFWIGNLTAKYQWGVLLGFYFGVRFLRVLASNNSALQPFLTPVIMLLTIFAFSTWVIKPVGNLLLRFNPFGKFILRKEEIMSSNFVAASVLVCLAGVALFAFVRDDRFLMVAAYGFAMMVPFSVMFSPSKYKYALLIYAGAMALVGGYAISVAFSTGEIFNAATTTFGIGFVVFQWLANFFLIKESNR